MEVALTACALLSLAACSLPTPAKDTAWTGPITPQVAPLEKTKLEDAQQQAIEQLLGAQLESGFFDYDFDFRLAGPTGKSNIVRQAGTSYALGEAYWHTRDKALRRPLQRAVQALSGKSIPVGEGSLVSFNGKRSGIKGGATALALLAEIYYFRTSGNGRFERQREAWLRGLIGLHLPGAGFRRSPDSREESHYYNGEVWLALAFYNATFDAPEVAKLLEDVDRAMMRAYGRAPHIGFFHWGVMAAERRYRDTGDDRFTDFIQSQTRNFLVKLRPNPNPNSNSCYSLEGLLPALSQTPPESAMAQPLRQRIDWEMQKILTLQIQPGQKELTLADGTTLLSPHLPSFTGAFLASRKMPLTRIDYTQHCLSALLKYQRQQSRQR